MKPRKIIFGAQTGADRAGLDAAKHLGIQTAGFIPGNAITEEGPLTEEQIRYYDLSRVPGGYAERTRWNALHSDGTAIFGNISSAGSRLTRGYCNKITVLNVAGNRESVTPGIYQRTFNLLVEALSC